MDNVTFAAAMRQEAEKRDDVFFVSEELLLQIAGRVYVSPDPEEVGTDKMNNKSFAMKLRDGAVLMGDIRIAKELWLEIADRIEASSDPVGTSEFEGFSYER